MKNTLKTNTYALFLLWLALAAGCGPSYESLSRDYSQSNYSSSRLSLLDDRDLWRVLQQWWLRRSTMCWMPC